MIKVGQMDRKTYDKPPEVNPLLRQKTADLRMGTLSK